MVGNSATVSTLVKVCCGKLFRIRNDFKWLNATSEGGDALSVMYKERDVKEVILSHTVFNRVALFTLVTFRVKGRSCNSDSGAFSTSCARQSFVAKRMESCILSEQCDTHETDERSR